MGCGTLKVEPLPSQAGDASEGLRTPAGNKTALIQASQAAGQTALEQHRKDDTATTAEAIQGGCPTQAVCSAACWSDS